SVTEPCSQLPSSSGTTDLRHQEAYSSNDGPASTLDAPLIDQGPTHSLPVASPADLRVSDPGLDKDGF
ncbi:hypothetical protein Dimus_029962, partial [Dionaea muscipula]